MSVVAKPVYSRKPICTDHKESEREKKIESERAEKTK